MILKEQRKTAVVLSYINIVLTNIVNFFYFPILLRKLGTDEYGLFSLCSSLIEYLAVINLGYASAYVRFYSQFKKEDDEERIKKLNAAMLGIYSVLGVVILLVGLLMAFRVDIVIGNKFAEKDYGLASQLLMIMTLNLAVTFPKSVFSAIITTHERFVFQRIMEMLTNLAVPIAGICLLAVGYHSLGISLAILFVTIVVFIGNVFYCFHNLQIKFSFRHIPITMIKDVLGFSVFLLLQSLSDCMNWQVDKLILARVSGSAAITYYTVGAKINSMLQNFSSAIYNVYIPEINREVAENEYSHAISALFAKVGRIQFMILAYFYTAFLLVGREFIRIWAGEGYGSSYIVAVLLTFPLLIQEPMMIGVIVLRAQNRNGILNVIYFGICIINVLISIPLSIHSGEVGAAFGSCITLVFVWGIVAAYYFSKIGKIDMKLVLTRIYAHTWKGLVPFFVLWVCRKWLVASGVIPLIIYGIAYTGIYWGIAYLYVMDAEEKDTINKMVKKIFKILRRN